MTLTQLNYIVLLDKFRNFGVAAQNAGITQPTLSMQIQKLEDELGVIIFDRSEQPIKTTKIGETLIKQAKVVLKESHFFYNLVGSEVNEISGELKIGVIPTLAPYLVPLFLKKYIKAHPDLKIILEELQTAQILMKLDEGSLDLGLLVTPIEVSGLESTPIFYEPFLAYSSESSSILKKSKVDEEDLNSAEIWLLSEGHCFREQSLLICKNRKKISDERKNVSLEGASLETLKKIIDQGTGFTLLPYLATLDVAYPSRLKEFNKPVPSREVSLVYSKYFRKLKLRDSLMSSIANGLPDHLSAIVNKKIQVVDLPSGKIKRS